MSRLKWVAYILLLFSNSAYAAGVEMTQCPAVQPEKDPFWRRKEKIAARIRDERYVAVAVNTRKPLTVLTKKQELYLLGAVQVDAPMDFAYVQAQHFEAYPKMSSMIKSSKWEPAQQHLELVMEAFKYRARLKMKIDMPPGEASHRDIRFCVIEGNFTGMGGLVRLEKLAGPKSQISLTALQGFDKLPMPGFFLEFGMEMAMQIAAGKIRGFVEEAYRHDKAAKQKTK